MVLVGVLLKKRRVGGYEKVRPALFKAATVELRDHPVVLGVTPGAQDGHSPPKVYVVF